MVYDLKFADGFKLEGDTLKGFTDLAAESQLSGEVVQKLVDYMPSIVKGVGPQAPDKYADFTLPEGMKLDAAMAEKAKGVFKELNLSQDAGQKLVGIQAEFAKQYKEASDNAYKGQIAEWKKESEKLLEGPDKDKKVQMISKAREAFATPEFIKFFGDYGFGDHPEVVKMFLKIGQKLMEDTGTGGAGSGAGGKSAGDILFPSTAKK
jgi:thiamine pyrophosphate-dependent acetolactate synthase large subunit-like protein